MFDRGPATAIPHAAQFTTSPKSLTGDVGSSDVRLRRLTAERALDQVLADSFPASDPPSWTLGVVRPEETVPRAPRSQPATGGAPYVSEVPRVERTFVDGIVSLAAAAGLVLLVPFAILLVGLPIALLVRGLLEVVGSLLAFISP